MITSPRLSRRSILAGLAVGAVTFAAPAHAASLDASDLGLHPASSRHQTERLQKAMDQAAREGRALMLPSGAYRVSELRVPAGLALSGAPGATLLTTGAGPIARIADAADVTLQAISFVGAEGQSGDGGLLEIINSTGIHIRDCRFSGSPADGLVLRKAEARVEACRFDQHNNAAIFSLDSLGLIIRDNRISDCGNNGILIWGSSSHDDNSIVLGNTIGRIDWRGGGNGQNGNGINVFRANNVIVSDNQISDCAFSAIRLNATDNTQVRGNTCRNSGEVAIFSEFSFSGSLISDNIVDGAAGGISVTNFNENGRLAVVSGNLVRNIQPGSSVNPDTTPFGIAAEADAAVTGNVVENVPGVGIAAGWGPYLRDVLVADNLVRTVRVGIAVSVAEGAGSAQVSGNMVSGATRAAIVGSAWRDIVSADLAADIARFPALSVSSNRIVP